jgi:uncharacterized protein YjbJ (UPF0337 family)
MVTIPLQAKIQSMSDQPETTAPAEIAATAETTTTPTTPTPVKGNWGEQKSKLKEQFPTLTDADLRYENGKKDEMLSSVQEKLGKTKEEFDTIIADL